MTTTTRLEAAASRSTKLPPATDKQIAFLASLLDRALESGVARKAEHAEWLLGRIEQDSFGLTKRAASNHIDAVKAV